jgi:peptide methionine sulfoxide reductase MsrB
MAAAASDLRVGGKVSDLAEWLLARIAEDERVVRYASANPHWPSLHLDGNGYCVMDRRRVLAECDAKREIVTRYEFSCGQSDSHRALGAGDEGWEKIAGALELCVRSLALPYADREGYREEWRP